jgi:hypothetical protein
LSKERNKEKTPRKPTSSIVLPAKIHAIYPQYLQFALFVDTNRTEPYSERLMELGQNKQAGLFVGEKFFL